MSKLNCWEFMKCGKNGADTTGSVICPIATESAADGLNGGKNGGRICWVIVDMFCEQKQKIQCCRSHSKSPCFSCEFRFKVMAEEGLLNVCNATGSYLQAVKMSK